MRVLGHAERYYPYPPARIWDVIADRNTWWIRPEGLELVVGNRFTMRQPAVLGTGFVGRYDCEITQVESEKRLAFRLAAARRFNAPFVWDMEWNLREHEGGTALAVTSTTGDTVDPQARVLLRLVHGIRDKVLHALGELLRVRDRGSAP